MSQNTGIGIGVITCNRPLFLEKCVSSINKEWYDELVIVNDGDKLHTSYNCEIIDNEVNLGVCKSKNIALKKLIKNNAYIFLVEDDMLFKDNVFQKYIEAYKETGIQHFSFGFHGKYNFKNGKPKPRVTLEYKNKISVILNKHSVGAVSFFTKQSLENVGFFDEEYSKYNNAFDHVDHSYRLSLKGYSTPYWWWADINKSWEYIEEQGDADTYTTIRKDNWIENVKGACEYFYKKHGVRPAWDNSVPDTTLESVVNFLKTIKI
jgi:GT2 family glycosyltransferase